MVLSSPPCLLVGLPWSALLPKPISQNGSTVPAQGSLRGRSGSASDLLRTVSSSPGFPLLREQSIVGTVPHMPSPPLHLFIVSACPSWSKGPNPEQDPPGRALVDQALAGGYLSGPASCTSQVSCVQGSPKSTQADQPGSSTQCSGAHSSCSSSGLAGPWPIYLVPAPQACHLHFTQG